MAWSASKVFTAFVTDSLNDTAAFDLDNSNTVIKAALYDDSITPSATAAAASTAYNTGVWTNAGATRSLSDSSGNSNWAAAGRQLGTVTSTFSSNVYTFDAVDLQGGGTLTITNAYGCLVYVDSLTTPVADQGLCFNYFGGAQTVTSGTFTIAWSTSGIFTVTV